MAQLYTVGQVIYDPELKTSMTEKPYLRFTLKEWVGYGASRHPQYTDVWAWGALAQQLSNAELKVGSIVWVSGSLELESYVKKDGKTHDKRLKLRLKDWGFVMENKELKEDHGIPQTQSRTIIDGEREPLPE